MDHRNNPPKWGPPQQTGYQQPYPPMQQTGQMPYPPMQQTGQVPYPPMQQTAQQPYPQMQQPGQIPYPQMQQTGYQQTYPMDPMMTGAQPYPQGPYQGEGYPPQQPAPPAGFMTPTQMIPQKKQRKWPKAVMALAVAAVLGVAVWYLYALLVPNAMPYGTIEAGLLGARYTGDCIIVRDETPFDSEGLTSVEYIADEGGYVQRTDSVCRVFTSGYSTTAVSTLQGFREDIRDYQKTLLDSETTFDAKMASLQSDILTRAKEIRSMIAGARGSLQNQEALLDAAISARQSYLKQKYSDDQRLSRLYDDERSQMQRIDSWTKAYAATAPGVVSFYSDGYEYGLTSDNYTTFSPAEVRNMFNGAKPEKSTTEKGKTTIFRLVEDGHWNVLFLAQDKDWNPVQGQQYELKLESFENTTVMATVEDFTRTGGELLVRLSVAESVLPVLYIRTCQAELGESVTTLKVPSRAIYTQDSMQGVVVVINGVESFIPINIVWEQDGEVYFNAVQQGHLTEGMNVRLF